MTAAQTKDDPGSDDRGRNATSPTQIPLSGWRDVLIRTWKEATQDNLSLIAAGVTFYAFLTIVPLLGSLVLVYGLVADPATVVANMQGLTSVMPADAGDVLTLMNATWTMASEHPATPVLTMSMSGKGVITRMAAQVVGSCATFAMVTAGVMLGRVLGTAIGKRAEIAGGVLLIAIGSAILAQHLSGAA